LFSENNIFFLYIIIEQKTLHYFILSRFIIIIKYRIFPILTEMDNSQQRYTKKLSRFTTKIYSITSIQHAENCIHNNSKLRLWSLVSPQIEVHFWYLSIVVAVNWLIELISGEPEGQWLNTPHVVTIITQYTGP